MSIKSLRVAYSFCKSSLVPGLKPNGKKINKLRTDQEIFYDQCEKFVIIDNSIQLQDKSNEEKDDFVVIDDDSPVGFDYVEVESGILVGKTALHKAARNGNLELVIDLINLGADIDAKDEQGKIPLHYACVGNHKPVIDLLFLYGNKGVNNYAVY